MKSAILLDNEKSLMDRSFDLLGDIIIERQALQLTNEVENRKGSNESCYDPKQLTNQDKHNLKIISTHCRMNKMRHIIKYSFSQLVKIATAILLIITLAGSIAVASSATLRIHLMRLLQEATPEYTRITLVEDEGYIDLPLEWNGDFYPALLPEGSILKYCISNDTFSRVDFGSTNSSTWDISYREYGKNYAVQLDTEDAILGKIQLRDKEVSLIIKEDTITCYWDDGTQIYVLHTNNFSVEDTISIAEGIRRIR